MRAFPLELSDFIAIALPGVLPHFRWPRRSCPLETSSKAFCGCWADAPCRFLPSLPIAVAKRLGLRPLRWSAATHVRPSGVRTSDSPRHLGIADQGLPATVIWLSRDNVTSTTVSLIAFACIFGGALIGVLLRAILPEHHFTNEAKDVFRLGLGLITTLTALCAGSSCQPQRAHTMQSGAR